MLLYPILPPSRKPRDFQRQPVVKAPRHRPANHRHAAHLSTLVSDRKAELVTERRQMMAMMLPDKRLRFI